MSATPSVPLRTHPLRQELNDEVHARPPEVLHAPLRASFLAAFADRAHREREWLHLSALGREFGVALPAAPRSHLSVDFGPFRLRYERHSEFSRYKFIVPGRGTEPFVDTAIARVPAGWLAALPGEVLVASHVEFLPMDAAAPNWDDVANRYFAGNAIVGAEVGDGAATALTDFHVHADGFERLLLLDRHLTPRQAGRMLQRLLEIDSYRMMALLALPVARELAPYLDAREAELAEIATALTRATEADEAGLLERLTHLEAEIESRVAGNDFRFGAASAYHDLVRRRIAELREVRIQGLPTFREFTERRLEPAMATCRTMAARQEALSARVARANELLATRIDISHERQNQALLESMDRRARVQLRLQTTVEGLSVAAFTYYVVGLVGYLAKALKTAGAALNPELVMGLSIPLVALVAGYGIHKIRHMVARAAG
ncbi:MAG: DUF3422 domain-containing protein [Proteobacteria bacterium]|nr:DUF3422 domain-containing protein [Pseudomonadota bacterium]